MASKAEIKKAILNATGNPESGPVFKIIDSIVDAIVGLEQVEPEKKAEERPAKETRVIKAAEVR
tara:strand:+ start:1964 stop:2155 length:192 start_codon:yes stop_codon:yes gene_type:complete